MAGGVPGSLASKCAGGAWSGALEGGGGTPRNTAAADDGSDRSATLGTLQDWFWSHNVAFVTKR